MSKGTANITGTTYINTNIPVGTEEAYASGKSKNDAVTSKNKGVVNININKDGGNTVKILGNLDVKGNEGTTDKGGTINIRLDTSDSYWYGEEVNYDWSFDESGVYQQSTNKTHNANLNVTLANGAQWVPDLETTGISKLTLKSGGIVNMHGFNEHVSRDAATEELTIGNLNTEGGVFRMDVNTSASYATGRNGSDFVYIKDGSGSAYVQPILQDKNELSKITYDNPVWFSDAASKITFKPYTAKETIEHGYLYDYSPIVAKNVRSSDKNLYGNNWYLVGLSKQYTETTETILGASSVDYATATARLEIDSLNKRLGELRDYDTAEKGVWVRWKGGEMESDDSSHFNNKYHFYQLGYDAQANEHATEHGIWHKGIAFHYTDGESGYRHGSGENDSRGVSLYAGWDGPKDHYADYVLKYSHLHNDFTARADDGTAHGEFSNYAVSLSAEYGRKNDMGHDWIFEPQSQLVYTYLSGADYTTSNHIAVSQDSTNSLIGRVGFRLGREYDQDTPEKRSKWYVKADLLHEFLGDVDVTLAGADATLHRSLNGSDTWLVYGLGADIALQKDTYFYCDFEKSAGGDIDTKWQANVGFRSEW